jgi:hypothetical protein
MGCTHILPSFFSSSGGENEAGDRKQQPVAGQSLLGDRQLTWAIWTAVFPFAPNRIMHRAEEMLIGE